MIRLHHSPQTRSMRSLWLLHELGIDFEVQEHAFGKNLREETYLELNPAGRVPALEIDGVTMFETGAITEILCERFSPDGLGRPAGHPERAEWLVWVHFSETISQHVAALTQQHIALYEDVMRSPVVMKIEATRLGKCYAALERQLQGRTYLVGETFTAADVSCAHAVYMGQHFTALEGFPQLSAWFGTCTGRSGFKASLHQPGQELYRQTFYAVPE